MQKHRRKEITLDDLIRPLVESFFEKFLSDKVDNNFKKVLVNYGKNVVNENRRGITVIKKIDKTDRQMIFYEVAKISVIVRGWGNLTPRKKEEFKTRYRCHKVEMPSELQNECLLSIRALELNELLSSKGAGNYCYIFNKKGAYRGLFKHSNKKCYTSAR